MVDRIGFFRGEKGCFVFLEGEKGYFSFSRGYVIFLEGRCYIFLGRGM